MTAYKPRTFTYRPVENVPENEDELRGYGLSPEIMQPGWVVVVNVERGIPTGQILDSLAEFNARFEPAE